MSDASRYARLQDALAGERLPSAFVDLDAVDANIERLLRPVRAAGKTLRVATKSIRCPRLIRYLLERGEPAIRGLMTYSARETAYWAEQGMRDLLLAYPTVQAGELDLLARANREGVTAAVVVDCVEHVEALARAAQSAGTIVPAVIEVDMAYHPLGDSLHLGVFRSPLRKTDDVVALAERIAHTKGLRFHGIMGYEAHVAGLGDNRPFSSLMKAPKRAFKRAAWPQLVRARRDCVEALKARGLDPVVVNGGGSGSVDWSSGDESLTEVSAGSGFVDSHLFDYFRDVQFQPAIFFAIEVVRRPAPGIWTCSGGGYVASGEAGADRLPRPWLPEGLSLIPREGAGEVQTPLTGSPELKLSVGDPVILRHAKAGELAEHFNEYLLMRGDRVVERAPTYRGAGQCFLG